MVTTTERVYIANLEIELYESSLDLHTDLRVPPVNLAAPSWVPIERGKYAGTLLGEQTALGFMNISYLGVKGNIVVICVNDRYKVVGEVLNVQK